MHINSAIATPVVTPAFTHETAAPNESAGLKKEAQSTEKENKQVQAVYTPEEQQQLQELKARDREVRAHEAAHLAAAGSLARGGASFSYQRGPDGIQYAIGGEVNIDTSAVPGDPEATLQKAQQIRAAALAPAQPSAQDISVAAQAAQLAVEARAEINQQNSEESQQETKQVQVAANDETQSTAEQGSEIDQAQSQTSENSDSQQPIDNFLPPPPDLTGNLLDLTA